VCASMCSGVRSAEREREREAGKFWASARRQMTRDAVAVGSWRMAFHAVPVAVMTTTAMAVSDSPGICARLCRPAESPTR
jgi:hypothetical protein